MRQRMLTGGAAIGGSIFCPSASSAGVGYLCGITHEQLQRDKECSIRQPDVPLLDDLPSPAAANSSRFSHQSICHAGG